MAQHFLLSAKARTLNLRSVMSMGESRAYAKFKKLRWPETNGKPVCPDCGVLDHWVLVDDRKWKCQGCRLQFTATSRTIFASRKLSFPVILGAIAVFTNGVLGVSAIRLSRECKVSYKTAFVLAHKLREAMGCDQETEQLSGIVEIDGAIFGGSMPRLPNAKALWDEYLKKNKMLARRKRKLIVVIREREHPDSDRIARLRTFLVGKEGDAIEIARKLVRPGTVVHADLSTQWEPLHGLFDTKRINHSEHFSKDGACTNQAESFFSRMRRAERGVYNKISGGYIHRYAIELAWREQHRRVPNGTQFNLITMAVGRSKESGLFQGYWQRHLANDNAPGAGVITALRA